MSDVYERLADALNALPNGFPRTETGSDIRMLRFVYSEKQAALACELTRVYELATDVAARLGRPAQEVSAGLFDLVREGKAWMEKQDGKVRFRLAPFVPGSYEAYIGHMSEEMARLVEEYFYDGGEEGLMRPQPAFQRVVPASDALDLEWILPHDNVLAILERAQVFHVGDCICRLQKAELGEGCDAPRHNCVSFSMYPRDPKPGDVTKEEAIRVLKEAEEVGLVHSVSNVIEGVSYVCNCCGCCCGILRGITEWGIANSMARANYEAVVSEEECVGCGTCTERCQVSAIALADDSAVVNRDKCLGCGLCVTTCPTGAVTLTARPEEEQVKPPASFGE
jgi:Fe-S-cluster-containing hydrogenase component 2